MKIYRTVTVEREEYAGVRCDGCGAEGTYLRTSEVIISVHEGEEGGRTDEYDYCDDCLVERAPMLVAAGSRAPLVTGDYEPIDDEGDE